MFMINESNYRNYFLNLEKGILTDSEIQSLMDFLEKNPELEEDLLNYNNFSIQPNLEINLNKNFLYKSLDKFHSVNDQNFSEFCIAYFEKDLSAISLKELLDYLNRHPEKRTEFEKFGKSHIRAFDDLRYPNKLRLKKVTPISIYKLI